MAYLTGFGSKKGTTCWFVFFVFGGLLGLYCTCITHSLSSSYKNSGPLHHSVVSVMFAIDLPLEGRSAGFSLEPTCRHCCGLVELYISPTLLATKGLNPQLGFLIHHNTFMLSVQKINDFWSTFKTLATANANLSQGLCP